MSSKRINKYLAEAGFCSRRQADQLIKSGKVFVNGQKAELGSQVKEGDSVKVGNKLIIIHKSSIYIAYHKPVGVICTTDKSKKDNIISKINIKERIYPVGRLDVQSSGLILLTNDGEWANKIMHPRYEHEKEYLVQTDKKVSEELINKLEKGIQLKEGLAKADRIFRVSGSAFRISLHQGWNRQIRRMLTACGYQVKSLKRVRVGKYKLGSLKVGEWQYIKSLRNAQKVL